MVKKKTKKKFKPKVKKQKKKTAQTVDELKFDDEDEKEKTDAYEEHACEYLNEAECEEELEEDGLDLDKVESDHFGDDKE